MWDILREMTWERKCGGRFLEGVETACAPAGGRRRSDNEDESAKTTARTTMRVVFNGKMNALQNRLDEPETMMVGSAIGLV